MRPTEEIFEDYLKHQEAIRESIQPNYKSDWVSPEPELPYVEIAGIKWAKSNLGAENPWVSGLYFQWGDTEGYTESQVGSGEEYKYFSAEDYKYWDGSEYTKYTGNDDKSELDSIDDAAIAILGEEWKIPSTSEMSLLENSTNHTWTNDYKGSGISGIICTDKTDSTKEVFLPVYGFASSGNIETSHHGYYWSRSVSDNSGTRFPGASEIFYDDGNPVFATPDADARYLGYQIRPIYVGQ